MACICHTPSVYFEHMFDQATSVVTQLRELVRGLEPRCLRGEDAARLLSLFAEAERLAGVGKALCARRVEETSLHKREGHRSAAEYVAKKTGTSVGTAGRGLETARRLEKLGETSDAWRGGKLSEAQAAEIAAAASADPSAERELVAAAATKTLPELAERCRRVRAAAASNERARHDALHRSRYLRSWTGADGAFRMDLPPRRRRERRSSPAWSRSRPRSSTRPGPPGCGSARRPTQPTPWCAWRRRRRRRGPASARRW